MPLQTFALSANYYLPLKPIPKNIVLDGAAWRIIPWERRDNPRESDPNDKFIAPRDAHRNAHHFCSCHNLRSLREASWGLLDDQHAQLVESVHLKTSPRRNVSKNPQYRALFLRGLLCWHPIWHKDTSLFPNLLWHDCWKSSTIVLPRQLLVPSTACLLRYCKELGLRFKRRFSKGLARGPLAIT